MLLQKIILFLSIIQFSLREFMNALKQNSLVWEKRFSFKENLINLLIFQSFNSDSSIWDKNANDKVLFVVLYLRKLLNLWALQNIKQSRNKQQQRMFDKLILKCLIK